MSAPPEKPDETVKEKADVEGMECEGSPSGEESDMNVDSPPSSEQPMSEEASSSARTGESLATEGAQASTSSTRSDLQDTASSSRAEESVRSGGTTATTSSTRSDLKDSGISAGTEGSPEGVISPRRKKLSLESIGEAIGKQIHRVKDILVSPRKPDSAGEGVVSPKSKGKSRTPKKGMKSPSSPGQGATLSPEQGEKPGMQRASPMKEGKPSRFRLFSGHKDKKGDQRAPQRLDLHRDPEQEENAQLTAIQSPPGGEASKGVVRKSKSFFGFGSGSKSPGSKSPGSKSPSAAPPQKSEDCLHLQDPKEKPDEKSDSTISVSLSPISERRESDWANFEGKFGIQPLDSGEQKAAVSKSPPEGSEETSETTSGKPSVTQPDVQQEMETEDKLEATSGEPAVADPAVAHAAEPEMETEGATGSDTPKPSVAEPATESTPRPEMEAEEAKDVTVEGGVPARVPALASEDCEEVHPSPSKRSKTDE